MNLFTKFGIYITETVAAILEYVLKYSIDNPDDDAGTTLDDEFGRCVRVCPDYTLISAPGENDGVVYIYNNSDGSLEYTFTSPSTTDGFGTACDICDTYAIIGQYVSTGYSGVVYIYDLSDGSLAATVINPNSDTYSSFDQFGRSVAVSPDGLHFIVGAPYEDATSTYQSAGVAYVYDSNFDLDETIVNPNYYGTAAADYFGHKVACSNNYFVVAAPYEDNAAGLSSGVVFVFNTLDNSLEYTKTSLLGGTEDAFFGYAVDITDDYLIVGAYGRSTKSGGVFVFDLTDGSELYAKSNENDYGTADDDYFGIEVSISDSYFAVGAYQEDNASGINTGVVYIYGLTDGLLDYTLDNPNEYSTVVGDGFGQTISITDSYITVGAPYEDDSDGLNSGATYLFSMTDGLLDYTFTNPNSIQPKAFDEFGFSCGVGNDYSIACAYLATDSSGAASSGVCRIFNNSDGTEEYEIDNPNDYGTGISDLFGYSCDICEDYAIVGAYQEDISGNTSAGIAYVFDLTDGTLLYTLDNPTAYGTAKNDRFGYSVAITDSYAIVGAYQEDESGATSSGKAYIFDMADGLLEYTLDNPNEYGTAASDYFGWNVGICEEYAIVGAYGEDSAAGSTAGVAYIYDLSDGLLEYALTNPNADTSSASDSFGYGVSISNAYAIVGAPYEDDSTYTGVGAAYIYDLSDGLLEYTLTNPSTNVRTDDNFGKRVAIGTSYAIVGSQSKHDASDNAVGEAYIYDLSDGSLEKTLSNLNSDPDDSNFGLSVGISLNGTYAAVGAPNQNVTGGEEAGAFYIYKREEV